MPVQLRPVHPVLRGLLAGPMVGYDLTCHPDAVHLGVPSLSATVILAFDEPLDVGWLRRPGSERHWASVSGLHLEPALIRTHGVQRGIEISLTPEGCRALFGMPIGAVASTTAPLAATAMHDELAALGSWPARLARLERHLLDALGHSRPPRDVTHAVRLLGRGTSVRETAREVGWSERHLATRVRAELGLRPKQVGRLGRLQRARALLTCGAPLAEVAHRAGFSDQAHLSREWRELTGQTPSAEQEFVFLQDLPGAGSAE